MIGQETGKLGDVANVGIQRVRADLFLNAEMSDPCRDFCGSVVSGIEPDWLVGR